VVLQMNLHFLCIAKGYHESCPSFCKTVKTPMFSSVIRSSIAQVADIPVTPCVRVYPASVLWFPRLTVVTWFTFFCRSSSFAQRKITSSSRPSPITVRKSTWVPPDASMPSYICVAAVPFDQSIGATMTASRRMLVMVHSGKNERANLRLE
jgi:hypothetical protein